MKYGSDQTTARDLNLEMVLKLLQQDYLSSSDLAKKMRLSKPALTKIMNEMLENNLVEITDHPKKLQPTVGRKKTFFKINSKAGMIGIINFASTYTKILLADLDGNPIDSVEIADTELITEEVLNLTVNKIMELKDKYETQSHKLLSICIAAPGQINKYTQEFYNSPKFKACKNIKIKDYFAEKCQVEVILKNDINLYILGEREDGLIGENVEDAILIHIDSGIGGAILNKGKLVEGEYGFAGEFGLVKTFDRFGNVVYYDSLCSTNSIKNQISYFKTIGEETSLIEPFKLKDVINAFHNNDFLVRNVVLESAKNIGILVSNLYNIFDCKNIFISGRVKLFGNDYLNEVKNHLGKFQEKINLNYTLLGDEAVTVGSISVALEAAFKILLENRKKNGSKG